jgi:hypothetical protein
MKSIEKIIKWSARVDENYLDLIALWTWSPNLIIKLFLNLE